MDPHIFFETATSNALPAPVWFIQFFKTLGFIMHLVPMNLWFAGVVLAMVFSVTRSEHARRFSARLMSQMPVIVALGVNFGIVPLLFIQLAYYPFFYPATILMAWSWLSIVAMLIPAYYGIYIYALGLSDDDVMPRWKRACGWVSAVLFIVIGFVFANGLSLMAHVDAWPELWIEHSDHGAAWGTALNLADPGLWSRWILMFGLALLTTAAWMVVDASWLARRESSAYRRWARRTAMAVAVAGAIVFGLAGTWYVFGTWTTELRSTMFSGPLIVLTLATAASPGLPLGLMILGRIVWGKGQLPTRSFAALVALAQLGVLTLNAVSRQIVQNVTVQDYFDPIAQPTAVEWSPLIAFLVTFVFGALVIGWLVAQAIRAAREPAT